MTVTHYKAQRPLTVDERNAVGGISDVVAHLLFHRGITDRGGAERFLQPDYVAHIHDPFLLKDAEKAAERIIDAMNGGERITLYSDYDADGIPGAVMWNDFFKRVGYTNYSIYIPHRHNEGFGLNVEAVEQLAGEGVKLLITLDCGISDVEPVRRANELGIQVIITDHHEPPAVLPPAFAIIDHKQVDCEYPDKNICGTGVGFKLIQAVVKKGIGFRGQATREHGERSSSRMTSIGKNPKPEIQNPNPSTLYPKPLFLNWKEGHEKWFLDMVGIATLSDMVPLIGENRVFAYYGMSVLRKSPRKGLVKLLSKLKISQPHLTEDDIGFMVTPRINAASRMGVPMDAFKLLAAETEEDAKFYADHLDEINNERKGIVASLVKEVKKIIKERYDIPPRAIVLGNPDWKPSLLGLVANTCAEEFDRPVFLWGRDGDNVIKGSCRSEGTSNIVEIMRGVPAGVFMQFGGHKHSGGFAVDNEQVHFLEKHLNDAAEKIRSTKSEARNKSEISNSKSETLEDVFDGKYVDMELSLDAVNWRLQEDIDKLAPFGMGNPKPLFIFRNVTPTSVRKFGKTLGHVEISFTKSNGGTLAAIAFFAADLEWVKALEADKNKKIDLVASIEKSMFRGRKELRLRVVDVLL